MLGGISFVAGAFVGDRPGAAFDREAYLRQIDAVRRHGAVPVIFQSHGLTGLPDDRLIDAYADLGRCCGRFIAFELGSMFAPFGKIYSLDAYCGLLGVPQCIGAKHSSLQRDLEWRRLILRDRVRPDFHVFTGNDLAIDMVMYGSDYLLGLSTFAPDLFARRDAYWAAGDPAFYELNDCLQYLGCLAFRAAGSGVQALGGDVPAPARLDANRCRSSAVPRAAGQRPRSSARGGPATGDGDARRLMRRKAAPSRRQK